MVVARWSRRTPGWAVFCTIAGALLMIVSGGLVVAGESLLARYDLRQQDLFREAGERYGEDIEGPLNILLAGLDTVPGRSRDPGRADSIMIIHVPAELDRAYLISLPRDLLVEIPPLPEVGYIGAVDKLNAAMFIGSQQVGDEQLPNLQRGFSLLAQTVGDLTGIRHWDAGVVLDFEGFANVVDAVGGVTVELDERIASRHRQPDGTHRQLVPGGGDYSGPQMRYEPGVPPCAGSEGQEGPFTCRLNGWQALDVARQRYSLPDGDFGRQHNQQRLLKAIMDQSLSRDLVTDPVAMDRLVRSAGDSLLFDGRGNRAVDFAFALRGIRPDALTMLGLPSHTLGTIDDYQGEQLGEAGQELFAALRAGELDTFLATRPEVVR